MNDEEKTRQALLYQAIINKDVAKVKQLLNSAVNREIADELGQTSLHCAAKTGDLEIIKLLLEYDLGKIDLNQFILQRDKNGKTALHLAAEICAINVIKYLRAKSKNQLDKIKDNKGFSALDGIRSIQTMKKFGDEKLSAEEKRSISDTIKVLIENPKLSREIEQLLRFIETGNLEGVKKLIKNNPELLESRNQYTNTPLFEAIYSKQFDIADYLIEAGADINARCHEGKSPLHRAVWVKDKKIVLELLKRGADVNARDDHEATPLLDAVGTDNNITIIDVLLKHGAILSFCNGLKRNIIHMAAVDNCCENIKYFFKKISDKAIFEQPDGFGRRPFHLAAEKSCIETIQLLFELDCEIDAQDMYGRTALHLAAEKNRIKTLALLVKLGCNIDVRDKYLRTALHIAASSGAIDVAEYLLNNGAKLESIDSKKRTPLHLAARDGQLEMIKYLVMERNADPFKMDTKERTPLVVAKTHQDSFVDQQGHFSQTRLHETCEFLLDAEQWYSQPKDSQAPQRFFTERAEESYFNRQQPKAEWKPRQPSESSEKGSWSKRP